MPGGRCQRVLDERELRRAATVERDEQVRLVNPVRTSTEVMADATVAGHAPREVVTELPLLLLRGLRRVRVAADTDAVREDEPRVAAAERDVVAEVGVLEDGLVQLRAAEHPVVIHVDRIEVVLADAPRRARVAQRRAIRLRIGVAAVTDREVMRRVEIRRHLRREKVLAQRRVEDAIL